MVSFQILNVFLPRKSKKSWMEYWSPERVLSQWKRECIPRNRDISITITTVFNWVMKIQQCYFLNVNIFFLKFKFWWMIKLFWIKHPPLIATRSSMNLNVILNVLYFQCLKSFLLSGVKHPLLLTKVQKFSYICFTCTFVTFSNDLMTSSRFSAVT